MTATDSDIREEGEMIEVDYDLNPTDLYTCICACTWDEALSALEKNPIESITWVVKRDPCSDDDDAVRFLPLHSACARQPPLDIIISLLTVYSEASSIIDDNGMYPLHYACANQASAEVIELLLLHHPDANNYRVEMNGSLPIHLSAQWGVSTPSVMEVLLHYNKSLACARDNDGLSPLELAMNAEEYEFKEDVIEILHTTFEAEAMNDGDDSTLSTRFSIHEKSKKTSNRNLMKELEGMRDVVIALHERKQHLMLHAEKQVALEWEAVELSIAAMKMQIEEITSREPVTAPSIKVDVEDDEEKDISICDESQKNEIEYDQRGEKASDTSTANTSTTGISEIEVKVEEAEEKNVNNDEPIDQSRNNSRAGLVKKVSSIGSKFTSRAWLSQWRQTAVKSCSIDSSVGYDKYANPLDEDEISDKGDENEHDMDCSDEGIGDEGIGEENIDLVDGTKEANERTISVEEQEIADKEVARVAEAKNEATRIAEAKKVAKVAEAKKLAVRVADAKKEAARVADAKKEEARVVRIKAQEERVEKVKEKRLKERRLKELQGEYEAMEREIAHCSRRRDAYITKVNIAKESVTELNKEIRRALKGQGETKGRLEVMKATGDVRRKLIKNMLREMDGDPDVLQKVHGMDALMKKELKATRVMDQILFDLSDP